MNVSVETVLETLSEDLSAIIAKQARELAIAKAHITQLQGQVNEQHQTEAHDATE